MCELLGINSNKYTNITFSFQQLKANSKYNPNGWGLAFYPYHLPYKNDSSTNFKHIDYRVAIYREDYRLSDSEFAQNLKDYFQKNVRSKNILAHIRRSTNTQTYANTHPYSRELWGHDWTLIHNGSRGVDNYFRNYYHPQKELHYIPIGLTGSDKILCILLSEIKNQNQPKINLNDVGKDLRVKISYDFLDCAKVIYDTLCDMKEKNADVNIILSDGVYLLGFFSGHNKLNYVVRNKESNFSNIELNDSHYKNVGLVKARDEQAVIIATEKITNEDWTEFNYNGGARMIICKDGDIIKNYP